MKGYKILRDERVEEIASRVILFEHEKTKARVLKVLNGSENKTFSIGFKTVQNDSTGVCHILEHSVLSGSRKYKTKEPFMDLVKNSLQTFVNAMTFDDMTIYPVSSRNEKDFYNLMDVYLDAVFFPAIYDNKKIFEQEGWHYELDSRDGDIRINGVVYNEMKGAMSSDESQVFDLMSRKLYRDSTYCTNSGGEPEDIPTLSHAELVRYHKEHYNPSNSYIFLWGNGNTDDELQHLSEYLDKFEYIEPLNDMKSIKHLNEDLRTELSYYGEEKEKNDFLVVSYICGDRTSNMDSLIHAVIEMLLVTEDGAPIKDRILREELASDVSVGYSVGDKLNFSIYVKNMDRKQKVRIIQIIDEELKRLIIDGVDEREYASVIRQLKYETKTFEDSPHMAIIAYIKIMQSWLYGGDPIDALHFNEEFKRLEENSDLVREYATKYLQAHRMELLVKPDGELMKKKEERLENNLRELKGKMSDDELDAMINNTKSLHEFQLREDSKEDKATIPVLTLEDISDEASKIDMNVDGNISSIDSFTGGYVYLNSFGFIKDMADADLQGLKLISSLTGKLDTEDYGYKDLNTEINMTCYDFDINVLLKDYYNSTDAMLVMSKSVSTDRGNIKKAFELFERVNLTTDFTDVKKVREIIRTNITRLKLSAVGTGVNITLLSALKNKSRKGEVGELLNGVSYIKYLESLNEKSDEELKALLDRYYKLYKEIFNADAMYHITAEANDIEETVQLLKDKGLYRKDVVKHKISGATVDGDGADTAIVALTDVNYCVDACYMDGIKGQYHIAANLLSNSYLHDNIRAKGGAYGDGISLNGNTVYLFSYRDPNIKSTFEVYEGAPKWLAEKELDKDEVTSLIIGGYRIFEPNLTPRMASVSEFGRYVSGKTYEDRSRELKEALSTTTEDIHEFARALENAMSSKGRAAFMNENGYDENKEAFKERIDL